MLCTLNHVQLDLSTSALVFPAVSFLMLAYGQRYVAITGRIRQLVSDRSLDPRSDGLRLRQVEVLRRRCGMIRAMQTLAVFSLLLGILSALVLLGRWSQMAAKLLFAGSLVAMIASLVVTLWEIQLSSVAVDLQIESAELELIRRAAP